MKAPQREQSLRNDYQDLNELLIFNFGTKLAQNKYLKSNFLKRNLLFETSIIEVVNVTNFIQKKHFSILVTKSVENRYLLFGFLKTDFIFNTGIVKLVNMPNFMTKALHHQELMR